MYKRTQYVQGAHTCTKERTHVQKNAICTRSAHMHQGAHTCTKRTQMYKRTQYVQGAYTCTKERHFPKHCTRKTNRRVDLKVQTWGPPSVLFNSYRIFLKGVKQPGREVTHLQLVQRSRMSGAVTPIPLYTSMAWTGNNFSFLHHTSSCPLYSIISPYLQYNVTSELLEPLLS